MHTHQYRLAPTFNIAAYQSHVGLASVNLTLISDQPKLAVACPDQRFSYAIHIALMLHAIANQLRNRQHFYYMLTKEPNQVGNAGHGAVIAHDFADPPCGNQSR